MTSDALVFCYRGGFLGWLLVRLALLSPQAMWYGLAWFAARTHELYFWVLALSYWLSFGFHYLSTAFLWSTTDKSNACGEPIQTAGLLRFEVVALYHYLVMAQLHELFHNIPFDWGVFIRRIVVAVFVPAVLIWSDNTNWQFALAGCLLGVAGGALAAASASFYWMPRAPLFLLWWTGSAATPFKPRWYWPALVHHSDLRVAYHVDTQSGANEERRFVLF
jgi:hypothetical protein